MRRSPPGRGAVPAGRTLIGISGFDYPNWRGAYYPEHIPRREWLWYASRIFDSIELNGTFYSLKSPAVYERWAGDAPDDGFVFAVKGGRFITHNLKLRRAETALANFFASGVLALGRTTGPFLWQLPQMLRFDAERVTTFLDLLPRDTTEAEALARLHDFRLRRGALVNAAERVPFRHALEVRHETWMHEEFYAILRERNVAFVVSETPKTFPTAHVVTADFAYVRLHGSRELYASRYEDGELEEWAKRIRAWQDPGGAGRDVYVYFDNDAKVHAPRDAERLIAMLAP